jgi:superfamily I DNA/RNA helicase
LSVDLLPPADLPWFKRLAARWLGRGLNRLQAQHRDSWFHGHAAGQRAGHADGVREGYEEGHLDGLEEGRQVLVIRDTRPAAMNAPGVDDALFDDWRLGLSAELKKRIKADVAARLPAHQQPSAAQWKMIFSDTPSTCVIAGAGAGKSTSLVLRIVLLVHYLGYELDALTVVTFTRESRKDFIARLVAVMSLWGRALSPREAQHLVRTFHSRILPMVRSLPGFAQLQAFENLGNTPVARGLAPDNTVPQAMLAGFSEASPLATEEADSNPFDLRLNDTQRQQMNLCYRDLLASDERFAELIDLMRREALQLTRLERDHPDVQKRAAVTELAAKRDEDLCDSIEDLWFRAGAWPIQGIEPDRTVLQINGHPFHCHGYIPALDAWVVLGFDPSESQQIKRNGAKLPVWAEWVIKRTLFQAFSPKPIIWLENYVSARRLIQSLGGDAVAGPGFAYKVKGELAPAPLLDAFVATAGFIENLGLDVSAAVAAMTLPSDDSDRLFFEALSRYWRAFEQHLEVQTPPIMTYNRMFALFGENNPENLRLISDPLLRSMSHLMIDEFQDVSPQIVSWLRASLREIRRRGADLHLGLAAQHSSLLVVGDDWQSIYGWRGSSPQYFTDFAKTFIAPATTRVMLSDNYRSHQHIIDAAEHLVKSTPAIAGKKARSMGKAASALEPVRVYERDDEALAQRLVEHYRQGDSVLVLYRKYADKSLLNNHIAHIVDEDYRKPFEQRRLKQLTYHSAKGLQADVVFMVGDCQHVTRSPYKNQLYRLADLSAAGETEGYDKAQRDEALRLAYVGVTRAIRQFYWYVDAPGKEGTAGSAKASDQVDGTRPFFEDNRPRPGTTKPAVS